MFALIAGVGLFLMIWGYQQADLVVLWQSPIWSYFVVMALMPLAVYSFLAFNISCNSAFILGHPMLVGVTLWSGLHVMVNGDLASLLLFGSFFIYSVQHIILVAPKNNENQHYSWFRDVGLGLWSVVVTFILIAAHRYYAGVSLLPWLKLIPWMKWVL